MKLVALIFIFSGMSLFGKVGWTLEKSIVTYGDYRHSFDKDNLSYYLFEIHNEKYLFTVRKNMVIAITVKGLRQIGLKDAIEISERFIIGKQLWYQSEKNTSLFHSKMYAFHLNYNFLTVSINNFSSVNRQLQVLKKLLSDE